MRLGRAGRAGWAKGELWDRGDLQSSIFNIVRSSTKFTTRTGCGILYRSYKSIRINHNRHH